MRNVTVHEYSAVSVPVVRETIRNYLPPLVPTLKGIPEHESRRGG